MKTPETGGEASDYLKYACHECGVSGVRLFRLYQAFLKHQKLTCVDCTQKAENRTYSDPQASQIGWCVAAVPVTRSKDGAWWKFRDSLWGYTSVPAPDAEWWFSLPIHVRAEPLRGGGR